jgi:hypothetical protein
MKMSRRALRMERRHKVRSRMPGFNIISLMDIFTILVCRAPNRSSCRNPWPPKNRAKRWW